jgi:hypothetical protein
MVVNCEQVWREISNFLDDDLDPGLRSAMQEHFQECKRCTAVLEGTRNVVQLYGDERLLEVPLGFDHRLHRRLDESLYPTRRTFFGWMVAAAAAMVVTGGFEVARSLSSAHSGLRSAHAQPGHAVPPDMMVVLYPDGKTFHVAGCTYIHGTANLQTVTAREAEREGYVPCVRCLKKYLQETASIGYGSDAS